MADRTYPALGAVKPHVRAAALEVGNKFDVATIHGIGARSGVSEHPLGLALDYMTNADKAKGDQIVAYLKANWKRFGVKYIIWQQAIDEGGGFKPMEDRGSATANHRDHVHVSFERNPGDAGEYSGSASDFAGIDTSGKAKVTDTSPLAFLTEGSTWIKVLQFLVGLACLGYALWETIK